MGRQCSAIVPDWQVRIDTPDRGTAEVGGRRILSLDGSLGRMKVATLLSVAFAAVAVAMLLIVAPA